MFKGIQLRTVIIKSHHLLLKWLVAFLQSFHSPPRIRGWKSLAYNCFTLFQMWNVWKSVKHYHCHVSPPQSPAGRREQVRVQSGHLSQGALCVHGHWWAGVPHHRRGQHSQGWCKDSPWCECADCVNCYVSLSFISSWTLSRSSTSSHKAIPSGSANPYCTQRCKTVLFSAQVPPPWSKGNHSPSIFCVLQVNFYVSCVGGWYKCWLINKKCASSCATASTALHLY